MKARQNFTADQKVPNLRDPLKDGIRKVSFTEISPSRIAVGLIATKCSHDAFQLSNI